MSGQQFQEAGRLAAALARVLREEGLHELTLERGAGGLRLRRRSRIGPVVPAGGTADAPPPEAEEEELRVVPVTSSVVGVVHLAPGPHPLLKEGDTVEAGQVLCIVESMSLDHEVRAPSAGRVLEVLVQEGDPVEYGQALVILEVP